VAARAARGDRQRSSGVTELDDRDEAVASFWAGVVRVAMKL
jgi:hypothetical protein